MHRKGDSARGVQIFNFDRTGVRSPVVDHVWRTSSEPIERFTSVAVTHWEIVFTRLEGETWVHVRGPETRATTSPVPQGADFVGVQFRLGAFMPHLPVDRLVDTGLRLPEAGSRSFQLAGSAWEVPTFDNVDVFVRRLASRGVVVRDPVVEAVLQHEPVALSSR